MPHSFAEQVRNNHERFLETLKKIRTGRAHPGMVAAILVEAYGAQTPLSSLASISVSDARSMVIDPWDKQILKAIEKSIVASDRNLSCIVSGDAIRVSIPPMTEESRTAIAKSLREELERSRIAVRKAREEEKKQIEASAKSGDLSEDERHRKIKALDQATKEAIASLSEEAENKEAEVMKV